MPLREPSTIQKRDLVNGISSSIIIWSIEKFLSSLFVVGYDHPHKLLRVIITHDLIMQEVIMYRQHVVSSIVMCDTCENKLTVGIICVLFYRRLDQFHYIIK
jgi:hypothetical protein